MRRNGFTLVEVLVALVVTAFVLAILFDASTSAGRRERANRDRWQAILLARQILTEHKAGAFVPGEAAGTDGRLRWKLVESDIRRDPKGLYVLARIDVQISRTGGGILLSQEAQALLPAVTK